MNDLQNSQYFSKTLAYDTIVLHGHGRSKATEIYTHVSKKSLENSKSPLDAIIDKQKADNEHITKIKT